MVYTNYEYYLSGYLLGRSPAVPEDIFCYWEKQARVVIDANTFGRIATNEQLISDKVKDCTCAITELLYKADKVSEQAFQEGAAGLLSSYSNDGESGTYDLSRSPYTEEGKKANIQKLLHQYLGDTGLLYPGLDS